MKKIIISMIVIITQMLLNGCTETRTPKLKKQAQTKYNNGWVEIARDRRGEYRHEFNVKSYNENKNYVQIISQMIGNSHSDKVYIRRKYILIRDCKRGVGKIITKNLDGKFMFKHDFVRNGSSVSSGLADVLCYLYTLNNK